MSSNNLNNTDADGMKLGHIIGDAPTPNTVLVANEGNSCREVLELVAGPSECVLAPTETQNTASKSCHAQSGNLDTSNTAGPG